MKNKKINIFSGRSIVGQVNIENAISQMTQLSVQLQVLDIKSYFANVKNKKERKKKKSIAIKKPLKRVYNTRSKVIKKQNDSEKCNIRSKKLEAQTNKKNTLPDNKKLVKRTETTSTIWDTVKRNKKMQLSVGDFVIAKMATFSPWPARIIDFIPKNKKIEVFWFGDNRTGKVLATECVHFTESEKIIVHVLNMKVHNYRRAIHEAEISTGIGFEESILNKFGKSTIIQQFPSVFVYFIS